MTRPHPSPSTYRQNATVPDHDGPDGNLVASGSIPSLLKGQSHEICISLCIASIATAYTGQACYPPVAWRVKVAAAAETTACA